MKVDFLTIEGAHITVRTKSGAQYTGQVDKGHVWADEANTLCLAVPPKNQSVNDTAELLWIYIDKDEIESWAWDCRP